MREIPIKKKLQSGTCSAGRLMSESSGRYPWDVTPCRRKELPLWSSSRDHPVRVCTPTLITIIPPCIIVQQTYVMRLQLIEVVSSTSEVYWTKVSRFER